MTTPCPESTIYQMIQDGTTGTTGPGLQQDYPAARDPKYGSYSDVQLAYRVARIFNSGSIGRDSNGNYDLSLANGATASYASDIANRLLDGVVFDLTGFTAEN